MATKGTVIVTGGSQGIGESLVHAFLDRGYAVVATSRNIRKASLPSSAMLSLVEGDIGEVSTAEEVVRTAIAEFSSLDHVVNNAGIFIGKPFVDYTLEEFKALVHTNLEGFLFVTQLAVKQMLAQGKGGSVTTITTSRVDNPNAASPSAVAMITKGGLNTVTKSLATEYAKQHIRFNAVAPGIVATPMHTNNPADFLKTLSPMGTISDAKDIADAVVYLAEARHVTGEILHVDGGAHQGTW
jgi:NAD(P)-dependent dehydrogenase (short-subunit alcohol dehydrogenase family)